MNRTGRIVTAVVALGVAAAVTPVLIRPDAVTSVLPSGWQPDWNDGYTVTASWIYSANPTGD